MKTIFTMLTFCVALSVNAFNMSKKHCVEPDTMPSHTRVALYGAYSDKNPEQLRICEMLLDRCVSEKVFDRNGRKYYKRLKKIKSISAYMELIAECYEEDRFLDVVMETDEWYYFMEFVTRYH